jgi:TonB-linked SusC/RagA family outer membrane protein
MYKFYLKSKARVPLRVSIPLRHFLKCAVFLTFLLITNALYAQTQQVTLKAINAPLKNVFQNLSKQTGIEFLASTSVLKASKPVTINVQDQPLNNVLDQIFKDQPLQYEVRDKIIVVNLKEKQNGPKYSNVDQRIYGIITDGNDKSLPGATIKIKGTSLATTSAADGSFSFNSSVINPVLVISFIGYATAEYAISSRDQFPIKIAIAPQVSSLNQVQIIGYGTTTKRLNTGSVGTVTAKEIEVQPVSNPLAALQGKVSGVLVQTQNGLPGGGIKVQIRGQGSLASGTDPLYIVDGIPFLSTSLTGINAASGANGAISPLSIINPDDIESIDILKDADATAIYGSRAANGVVLITTKKGAKGKEIFTLNISEGINRIARLDNKLLNLSQYLQLRRQAFANDGETPDMYSAPDLMTWDTTKSTNWQKYFYGGTAHVTNVQGSLSGGDEHNQYLLSGNYHRETSILPSNQSYVKGGAYFSQIHHSNNNKFTASTSVNYNKDQNNTLYSSINSQDFLLPPNFPIYNPDGSFNWDIANPIALLQQRQVSQTTYLNANEALNYTFTKSLSIHLNGGYNTYQLHQVATIPLASQDPGFDPVPIAYFADNLSQRYIIEPQVNYSHTLGKGSLTALVGGTYQHQNNTGSLIEGDGVSNPALLGNLGAASTIVSHTNTYTLYKYVSVFSRLNYNYQDKYLIDINFRRDGSSRFGPNRQFGNFYAIGAGWIFSEETFFKNRLPFISYGKLRGSIGTTGNDQITDYQYLSTYGTNSIYGGLGSLTPNRVANPNYSWETTHKLEAAIELGVLSNRLMFTGAWYRHISSNQLIAYKIPYLTGFATYQANFPATIENTGIELDLNARIIESGKFHWKTAVNLTLPRNKLKSFPNLAGSSYANNYVVGQDLSVYRGLHFLGVNPQTGNATFEDVNHDGSISIPGDLVTLGKTSPDLFGGWSNDFTWKDFALSFSWEFVKRNYPAYQPLLGGYPQNDPAYVVGRWQKPGDITNIPRASIDLSTSQYNSSQLTNANYARLKNAAISYNLPGTASSKIGLKSLNIYLNGENLLVIANKNRFDPEMSGTSIGIPPLKTLVLGLKASL